MPTHLKEKFQAAANEFKEFDTNHDNVIDSDEFGAMLDKIMEAEGMKG